MKETTTSATMRSGGNHRGGLARGRSKLRSLLPDGRHRHPGQHDGRGCGAAVRPPLWPSEDKAGHRWGKTKGKIGFHGGKVEIERPRVRARDGGEVALPSWETAICEDLLGKWAMNLMLINVSTRRFGRAVRLPEGDVPAAKGTGVSKSAASRRFVALSAERMAEWMAADLSELDLLVIQIDGIHIEEDLILVAAVGIDGEGGKHPLGVIEGATENAAVAQALLDNLIERGLDPAVCRLFIIDGAKALSKAIRQTFGRHTADPALPGSQGPQHHRAHRQTVACRRPQGAASGVGTRRCREGGKADPQPRPAPGTRGSRRLRQHPRRHRRNPHRYAASACRRNCAARSPAPTSSRT